MNEDILNAIVKLMEAGGAAAVWCWFGYLGTGLLKFVIGFGTLCYVARCGVKAIYRLTEVVE